MLDKLCITPPAVVPDDENPYFSPPLSLLYNAAGYGHLDTVDVTPRDNTEKKNLFVSFERFPGIIFRCIRNRHITNHLELRVASVELNPNHACFGGSFLMFCYIARNLLDPCLFTSSITRVDYALDLPITLRAGIRGLQVKGAKKYIDHRTSTVEETLIVGKRPKSVAVYDKAKQLAETGQSVPSRPLTRVEARFFARKVPQSIKRPARGLETLRQHVQSIADGHFEPFHGITLHDSFTVNALPDPPLPDGPIRLTQISNGWMTRHDANTRSKAYLEGLIALGQYAAILSEVKKPRSGLRRQWAATESTTLDLDAIGRARAAEFLQPNDSLTPEMIEDTFS